MDIRHNLRRTERGWKEGIEVIGNPEELTKGAKVRESRWKRRKGKKRKGKVGKISYPAWFVT